MGDLAKDKKNRSQHDRFRDILFEIIANLSKENDSIDWLIGITLPAFIIIVRARIEASKSMATAEASNKDCDEIIKLMKLYLNNTVSASGNYDNDISLIVSVIVYNSYLIRCEFRLIRKISTR